MFHLKRTVCVLLVLATLAFAVTVEAATFYVATTGNDSNPGSQSQPFLTIAKGVSVLTPGDTLFIRGGSYVGHGQFENTPSGTSWSQPVTVKAFPGETVTILGTTPGQNVVHMQNTNHHIILDGLIIDGQNLGSVGIKITIGAVGGGIPAAHHIRVQNGTVRNAVTQGILVTSGTLGEGCCNEFINLKVHNNGNDTQFRHGVYFSTADNIVDRCEIYNNAGFGVHIYGGSEKINARNIIRNSIIRDHTGKPAIIFGTGIGHQAYNNVIYRNNGGIQILYGGGAIVSNNTLYQNNVRGLGSGILLSGPPPAAASIIENNLIYGHTGYGISVEVSANTQIIRNNLSSNNNPNFRDLSGTAVLSNNLFGNQYDPKFVNGPAHNFRLQSGSAAIDKGIAIPALSVDLAGSPRLLGPAIDIGAFELSPVNPAPPKNLRVQ